MIETNQNPNQKRNKIILIVVIGLIALCLIVCGVAYFSLRQTVTNMVEVDPEKAKSLATQITDYDLPTGYKEMVGTSTFGLITVAIMDEAEKNTIWLLQSESGGLPDPEKFLQDGVAYQSNNPITWTSNDIQIYTIRDKESSITKYDGITQDGKEYHAWAGKFTGKGGNAIIVIVGPDETWDENMAETFINSMR